MRRGLLSAALLLLLCACTAVQPEGMPPPEETSSSGVYTDWSKLEEREPTASGGGSRSPSLDQSV